MNNNSEQPEDLFVWAEHSPSNISPEAVTYASPDDGLGWNCPQCEIFGRDCPECAARNEAEQSKIIPITGYGSKSSDEARKEAIEILREIRRRL